MNHAQTRECLDAILEERGTLINSFMNRTGPDKGKVTDVSEVDRKVRSRNSAP